MRLARVRTAHRLREKTVMTIIRLTTGHTAPDVVRTLFYRPELFGRPMNAWTHAVMRGPSPWTVGERELFAAVVSRLNHCPF